MTVERAAEIMDPKSKEKFYGESGKQEVPCAFRHEVMMMRETFWPEDVERARIEG